LGLPALQPIVTDPLVCPNPVTRVNGQVPVPQNQMLLTVP
jgi:hypothetical protein